MKYRIPFKMLFDWAVPYAPRGNLAMALFLPAGIFVFTRFVFPRSWVLMVYFGIFTVYLAGYHQKISFLRAVILAVGMAFLGCGASRVKDGETFLCLLALAAVGGGFGFLFQKRWATERERRNHLRRERWSV
jgi:hypothetical protein